MTTGEGDDRLAVRVRLTGDRQGEYVVTEERPDGSLLLKPDRARPSRASVDSGGMLMSLFRRRADRVSTTSEGLQAWGVDLLEDERVVEFGMADVAGQRGFVALTDRRLIFLVRGRSSLEPRVQHPLRELTSVEPMRGRGHGLVLSWQGSEPMVIESRDHAHLERLEAGLLAR